MDDLSVTEAANVLGVDDSRVRQMLRSGVLQGRHVGRAWVVSGEALSQFRAQRFGSGRPLAPKRAWALLDLLDGGKAPWLDKVARSQVRAQLRQLAGEDPPVWRSALRTREERLPVSGHRAAISRLSNADDVWPAGPAAAAAADADLVAPNAVPEFYISAKRWSALAHSLHLSPAAGRPDAVVRVPREIWPFGSAGPGRAALAASLLESGEWRAARAGGEVLNDLAKRFVP
jgi:excisionase family DNA binding protein